MLGVVKSVGYRLQRHPLRIVLMLVTVAIGVGVLAVSLSVSFDIGALVNSVLPANGRLVSIANGTLTDTGRWDRANPPQISQDDMAAVAAEYPQLTDITPIAPAMGGGTVQVGSNYYQVRAIQGVGSSYAGLLRLHMAAGSFFTDADVANAAKVAVVSESAAKALFGSADLAIGKQLSAINKMVIMRKGAGDTAPVQQTSVVRDPYTVVGVFSDLTDTVRRAYGLGDALIPYTSNTPKGVFLPAFIMSFMARVSADQIPVARAKVTEILKRMHGDDFAVALWEGNPDHPDDVISDSRDALERFSLFLSGLGVLVLVVSCFSILSLMLVEVMDRNRELGLRRAMGATRTAVILDLVGQGGLLALLGALGGAALAVVFRKPLLLALSPYLQTAGVGAADLSAGSGILPALLVSVAAAIVAGAVSSVLPALLASRRPIVECLREE